MSPEAQDAKDAKQPSAATAPEKGAQAAKSGQQAAATATKGKQPDAVQAGKEKRPAAAVPAHDLVEAEKQHLLQLSEISLQLDGYDDIFSDFDPRPFSQRALSEDFLVEAQRASRDNVEGKISLKFLMPVDKRKESDEAMIKKRLKEYFKKHHGRLQGEVDSMVKNGALFVAFGVVVMLVASLVLFFYATTSILSSFLVVFLEPAGWFFFWEGLYQVMFESKKLKPNLDFYKKMGKCEISFISY